MKSGYKLQYISDIHLEFRKLRNIPVIQPIEPGNTYLALCGDIGNPFIPTYEAFLSIHSKLFVHILIVSGNHEYYSGKKKQRTITQVDKEIYRICETFDNVTYLNMDKIIIGRTKFLGCIFWSDVSQIEGIAESVMNDYKNIYVDSIGMPHHTNSYFTGYKFQKQYVKADRKKLKGSDVSSYHQQMKNWITKQIRKFDPTDENTKYDTIIILTHHAPSFSMLSKSDLYSPCYGTNCDDLFVPPVKYWISGHTHVSKQVNINHGTGLSNCMGYPGQKVDSYSPQAHIIFN